MFHALTEIYHRSLKIYKSKPTRTPNGHFNLDDLTSGGWQRRSTLPQLGFNIEVDSRFSKPLHSNLDRLFEWSQKVKNKCERPI